MRPQPAALPEEVQRAIRRNRAKAQKKENVRVVVEEKVVAVLAPATPRQTRDDVPNVPAVVLPEGGRRLPLLWPCPPWLRSFSSHLNPSPERWFFR